MGIVVPLRTAEPEATSDGDLVRAAREGDLRAQETLYRRHAPMVYGLAHRLLGGSRDEVDDLAQDAFVQALSGLSSLQDPQSFAKWLGTIVVRSAQRRIRKKRLRRRLGLVPTEPVAPDALVSADAPTDVRAELIAIYRILDELPTDVRLALVLRRVEGLAVAEIAERMDLSPATVKRRIQAGEVLLKGRLSRGDS
ncbi:MAG: sigma-70 family RNA polymerase sigma factor [Myxococcota bacterium]